MTNQDENNNTGHNVPPVDSATITRTTTLAVSFVLMALSIVNQYLTANGHNPLAIDQATVVQVVTYVCGLAAAIWAWWKPNHFTEKARETYTIAKVLQEDKLLEEAKKKYIYSNQTVQKLAQQTTQSEQAATAEQNTQATTTATETAQTTEQTTPQATAQTAQSNDLNTIIQQLQK